MSISWKQASEMFFKHLVERAEKDAMQSIKKKKIPYTPEAVQEEVEIRLCRIADELYSEMIFKCWDLNQ